ncbi:hypothetical protein ACWIUD_11160 [Helicobacter sp. 23-1044]
MKRFILLLTLISAVFGEDLTKKDLPKINPSHKITAKDSVNYISVYKNNLYASTNSGEVEIYNLNSRKKVDLIRLPNIVDLWGESNPPRVFNTHTIDGKKILIVSQATADKSNLHIFSNGKLQNIDLGERNGIIKNAFFVSDDEVVLGLRSFEIVRYNVRTNAVVWSVKPDFEVFTDLQIYDDKVLSSTEGGTIYIIDLQSGKVERILNGANLDYIYALSTAKGVALTAGRDKICGAYNLISGNFKRVETEFMAYSVAISRAHPLRGAVGYNENGDILVFGVDSLDKIALLSGGNAPLNQVLFSGSNMVLAIFGGNEVLFWNLNAESSAK